MNLKFLYTDDKTGLFSDTTLRTWLLFILFFVAAILLLTASVAISFGMLNVKDIPEGILDFFSSLGVFCLGGQAAYLGKRINERLERKRIEDVKGQEKPDGL